MNDYDDEWSCHIPVTKKEMTRRYGRGEHVMNSNESAVMRRLQSETGKSEDEIRQVKKYRVMLSEAQTAKGPGDSHNSRIAKRLLSMVTRDLQLAAAHPAVVKEARKLAHEYDTKGGLRFHHYGIDASDHDVSHHMKLLIESKS